MEHFGTCVLVVTLAHAGANVGNAVLLVVIPFAEEPGWLHHLVGIQADVGVLKEDEWKRAQWSPGFVVELAAVDPFELMRNGAIPVEADPHGGGAVRRVACRHGFAG